MTLNLRADLSSSNILLQRLRWQLFYSLISTFNSTSVKPRSACQLPIPPPLKRFNDELSLISSTSIPPLIHIVWIGDESKLPILNIQSWIDLNPNLHVKVWGNHELFTTNWFNIEHIRRYWDLGCYNGVADIMRYEILYHIGGFAVDADSFCVQEIPLHFLTHQSFTCYENSYLKPNLLSTGYFASAPATLLLQSIIMSINNDRYVTRRPAWISVGPVRLTQTVSALSDPIHIFPHHFFIPQHYSGFVSTFPPHEVYAHQYWSTTLGTY